jgi:transposase
MTAPAKYLDLSVLPPEYRAVFEAQAARVAQLEEINKRQEHLIAEMQNALYGKKSEKLGDDDRQLAFEDLEVAIAEVEERKSEQVPDDGRSSRKKIAKLNRGNLPEGLPRIEQVIEPDSLDCPCGCGAMHRISEDRNERIDIVPAQLRVIVTVRPKYACRICTDGITQAPTPPWLIEGGLPTEGAIAYVLVSKYADHLPLYRQSQILARSGLDIHRSTLADWTGVAGFHLRPVVDRLAEHLRSSTKLFMDETTAPVLDPGQGRTKTGYLWALARDDRSWGGDDPPGVVCFYAPGRHGAHAETFLTGFNGTLQIPSRQICCANRLPGNGRLHRL